MSRLMRYLASQLPVPWSWRVRMYRASGMSIGREVTIDRHLHVTAATEIAIGDRVTISAGVSLLADVTTVNSRLGVLYGVEKRAPITLGDDAYIGVKATILPGVRVGQMATVAANSLVVADVPDRGVAIGVPARVLLIRPQVDRAP